MKNLKARMLNNILLIEDAPDRKSGLLEFFNGKREIYYKNLDVAVCTSEAIKRMSETSYDLVILDVILPVHVGGEKSEQNSINLLEQLNEPVEIKAQEYIVALSESDELSAEAKEFFSGMPWGLIKYSETNCEYIQSLDKIINYIITKNSKNVVEKVCDIFIITALESPEFQALENEIDSWSAFEPLDDSQLVKFAKIVVGGKDRTIAAAFSPRMGPVASAVLTTKVMLHLKPKLVIMSGICAGVKKDSNFGDVIASEVSWDWQSGKYSDVEGNEVFEISPHQIDITDQTMTQLTLFRRDEKFWGSLAYEAAKLKLPIPKLIIGPVATGSSVLADVRVSGRISEKQHRKVAGLDMEIYGVYAAARSVDKNVNFMALKSVCDKGDEQKDDKYQAYASKTSAVSTIYFIENYSECLLD
jgi:nucleoside phosphorylase